MVDRALMKFQSLKRDVHQTEHFSLCKGRLRGIFSGCGFTATENPPQSFFKKEEVPRSRQTEHFSLCKGRLRGICSGCVFMSTENPPQSSFKKEEVLQHRLRR